MSWSSIGSCLGICLRSGKGAILMMMIYALRQFNSFLPLRVNQITYLSIGRYTPATQPINI
ncbi:hypothetical protein BJX61DRAFT_530161 [Aspergillus egyptiacus]|nr:hypothetical protein BJX61DRAFT_530161 [Aspergillus egyptiacus]